MIELFVVVEGQTEEEFIKRVVAPHLLSFQIYAIPIVVMTRRERDGRKHKGGGRHWAKWKNDILRIAVRPTVRITTLFDLYGLPSDFPELSQHSPVADTAARAALLEGAMARVIGGSAFIPYLQRHEFEALVLAALPALQTLLDEHRDRIGLEKLAESLGEAAPEDVNDGAQTAPSKRLQAAIESYDKLLHGPLATEATGLVALRSKCPRFDSWIARLEGLAC